MFTHNIRALLLPVLLVAGALPAFGGTSSSAGDEPDHTISIAFGTYAGECIGYCVDIYELRKSPILEDRFLTRTQHGWDRFDPSYPLISSSRSVTAEAFQRLTAMADLERFSHLADRYGCPDCADGGAYWIRIAGAFGSTGRVDYDRLEDVEADLDPELFRTFFAPLHAALFGELRGRFATEGVKLYEVDAPRPGPLCDLHTKLVIGSLGDLGFVAIFKADLTEPAACDAAPNPLARAYRIREATTDACHSVYYDGVFDSGPNTYTARIEDHRGRTCDDRPATVDVIETAPDGTATRLSGSETDKIFYP